MFMPKQIKTIREKNDYNGRFINPPFLFGAGGVELLAKEMTIELQQLKAQALTESFHQASAQANGEFTTARLWGVRDTAPYFHDGRATTISEAILMHGGEAEAARDAFNALGQADQDDLIAFLYTLRSPEP